MHIKTVILLWNFLFALVHCVNFSTRLFIQGFLTFFNFFYKNALLTFFLHLWICAIIYYDLPLTRLTGLDFNSMVAFSKLFRFSCFIGPFGVNRFHLSHPSPSYMCAWLHVRVQLRMRGCLWVKISLFCMRA